MGLKDFSVLFQMHIPSKLLFWKCLAIPLFRWVLFKPVFSCNSKYKCYLVTRIFFLCIWGMYASMFCHKLIFSILLYAFEWESTALLFEFMAVQIQERAGRGQFFAFYVWMNVCTALRLKLIWPVFSICCPEIMKLFSCF